MANNQGPIIDNTLSSKLRKSNSERQSADKSMSEAKSRMTEMYNDTSKPSKGVLSDYKKNAEAATKRPTLSSASERHVGIGSISRPDTPLANTPEPKK